MSSSRYHNFLRCCWYLALPGLLVVAALVSRFTKFPVSAYAHLPHTYFEHVVGGFALPSVLIFVSRITKIHWFPRDTAWTWKNFAALGCCAFFVHFIWELGQCFRYPYTYNSTSGMQFDQVLCDNVGVWTFVLGAWLMYETLPRSIATQA